MAKYRVIKDHDGLKAGTVKEAPAFAPWLREVLGLGLWEPVDEEPVAEPEPTPASELVEEAPKVEPKPEPMKTPVVKNTRPAKKHKR